MSKAKFDIKVVINKQITKVLLYSKYLQFLKDYEQQNIMSEGREVKFDIKVVINKEKTKVLFAEAGSDFTDVLLSILLLPLGTIMKVLKQHYGVKEPVVGSLNTLYKLWPWSDLRKISDYQSIWRRLKFNYFDPTSSNSGKNCEGVFTKRGDSFIIFDDLQIMPAAGSFINTLSKLCVPLTDMDGAETRNVTFGLNELMDLLKESLISRNPLSAVILGRRQMNLAAIHKFEHRNIQIASSMTQKKMVLKCMIQKSTFKLLFAQSDHNFIDFLCGLISLPLGRVEWYYGSNSGLTSIDNLHRSIGMDTFSKYLTDASIKCNLINPTVYSSKNPSNEFFPLYFHPVKNYYSVKKSSMYMVSDDLTVAPMTITSGISVINEMKISFSDVREHEFQVGLEEGLSILKAAVTSTTALTDGLIKPTLKNP